MTDSSVYAIPSREDLRDVDPDGLVLQISADRGLKVSLLAIREGVAMNRD